MKFAYCSGIDEYPGPYDLEKCIDDAGLRHDFFVSLGFDEVVMEDDPAKRAILSQLEYMFTAANPGDVIAWSHSGHGTHSYDVSGDEEDEYDEALVCSDGTLLLDDEIRELIGIAMEGVHIVILLDTCFSGSGTRKARADLGLRRYIPPKTPIPPTAKLRHRFLSEESMVEVLMTGCGDDEYSYEGSDYGAFTKASNDTYEWGDTYIEWWEKIRKVLPSHQFPQSPQIEGKMSNKIKPAFLVTDEEPTPAPEPKKSWLSWWWALIPVGLLILYFLLK